MMTSTHNSCYEQLARSAAQCTTSCAVTGTLTIGNSTLGEILIFGNNAAVLCAETPEARVGDPCTTDGLHPCLPTRAQLGTDGTVTGQTYLACASGLCQAAAPAVVTSYLLACDSTVVAQHGTQGVNGMYALAYDWQHVCLLAWDETTQAITSGRTRMCIGDWECPAGSLCDDQIAPIDSTMKTPVCKPGPRGLLTPQMLSP